MTDFLLTLHERPLIVAMYIGNKLKEYDGSYTIDCLNKDYFIG